MKATRYIRLYATMQAQNLQTRMEYKLDFLLGNVAAVLGQGVGIGFVWVIFQRIGDLGGWTLPQLMLLYGTAAMPYGLFELLFNGVWLFGARVRMGTFDEFMIRPVGPLFFVLSEATAAHGWGNFLTGVLIIVKASLDLGFVWSASRLAFLAGATVCGVVLYLSINLITATASFWLVGTGSSLMFMVQRLRDFSRYPLSIYSMPIRILLTWVVPFGFAGFYPSTILLGMGAYSAHGYLIPVVTVAFLLLAYGFWRLGLNHYQSTGS